MLLTAVTARAARVIGGRCPAIPTGTLVRVVEVHESRVPDRAGSVTAVLPNGRRVVLSTATIEYLP